MPDTTTPFNVLDVPTTQFKGSDEPTTAQFIPSEFYGRGLFARVVKPASDIDSLGTAEATNSTSSLSCSSNVYSGTLRSASEKRRMVMMDVTPSIRSQLVKKFEGFVVSIDDDCFTARFTNESDQEDFEAEIDFEEIADTDRDLVREGTRIVWTIGFQDKNGTRNRVSNIYCRRFPLLDNTEIAHGQEKASDLLGSLVWE